MLSDVKCDNCGKRFTRPLHKIKDHNFCSRLCYQKSSWFSDRVKGPKKGRKKIICDYCGKVFYKLECRLLGKKHFCSTECSIKYYSKKRLNGREVKCSNCEAILYRSLGELKKHKKFFCSNKCQGEWQIKNFHKENHPAWIKRKREMICDYCGNKTYRVPTKIMDHIFCSHECFGRFYSSEKHPCWDGGLIEIECIVCNNKFKVKQNRAKRGAKFCSQKCRAKHMKGKNHPMYGKKSALSYLNKDSIFQEKRLKALQKRPTTPEQRIIDIIIKYNLPFKYVGDGSFWIHNLNPDFIRSDDKKQIIEVFGIAFHSSDIRNVGWKQTEFGRKAIFSHFGYKTLILWDYKMKKLTDIEIFNKIKIFR